MERFPPGLLLSASEAPQDLRQLYVAGPRRRQPFKNLHSLRIAMRPVKDVSLPLECVLIFGRGLEHLIVTQQRFGITTGRCQG